MDELVNVNLAGQLDELIDILDQKCYRKYTQTYKNKPVLYATLKRYLCGILWSVLLLWRKPWKIEEMDIKKSTFMIGVYQKILYGKQWTIFWNIEDLKISHVNPEVVTSIKRKLE